MDILEKQRQTRRTAHIGLDRAALYVALGAAVGILLHTLHVGGFVVFLALAVAVAVVVVWKDREV